MIFNYLLKMEEVYNDKSMFPKFVKELSQQIWHLCPISWKKNAAWIEFKVLEHIVSLVTVAYPIQKVIRLFVYALESKAYTPVHLRQGL